MTAALLAIALSAVSTSKIGVVVETNDADTQTVLAACPALVVVRLPMPASVGTLLGNYRTKCTGGVVIGQVGGTGIPVDGTTVATNWQATWLGYVLAAQPLAGVEGPWEPTGITSAEVAAFWSAFALQVRSDGFLPVVGALAPAPPGPGAFCDTVTAVRNVLPAGAAWAWSYHARSTSMSQDAAAEATTTLGYRALQTACGLSGFSLYLTQAGPGARAWNAGDVSWLAWLDGQIGADAYVVGAAAGGTGGLLAPIASGLATYLANPQPPDAGTPDGGTDAGAVGGGVIGGGGVGGIGSPPKTGCATTGAGFTLLALVPVLALLRRRRSPTVKR